MPKTPSEALDPALEAGHIHDLRSQTTGPSSHLCGEPEPGHHQQQVADHVGDHHPTLVHLLLLRLLDPPAAVAAEEAPLLLDDVLRHLWQPLAAREVQDRWHHGATGAAHLGSIDARS